MEQWINTIFDVLKIVVIPLFCYVYKDLKNSIQKNNEEVKACININNENISSLRKEVMNEISKNDLKIEKVHSELNQLKSDLPLVYTLREDHIRALNSVDAAINKVSRKIDKLIEIKKEG